MKVGIFDSGMGGLSVLHRAIQTMPGIEFLYYADEEHVPYGEKSEEQIRGYIDEIIAFMLERKVDAIVIACNTATSVATKEYRNRFPVPIIGMEPAVKLAVEEYKDVPGRILVAATPVTIAGDKLHNLVDKVDKRDKVDLVALPKLVRFAEQGEFGTDEVVAYLKEALQDYPVQDYKAFVLGCTHFNYFKESYMKIFPKTTRFVDGNAGTLRQLARKLAMEAAAEEAADIRVCADISDTEGMEKVEYYFSGRPVTVEEQKQIERYMHQLDEMAAY